MTSAHRAPLRRFGAQAPPQSLTMSDCLDGEYPMKFAALVAAGLITLTAPALAQYYVPRPMAPIGPLPPASVSEMVRQMGLTPVGAPVRSGPVYFQRAADYYGKPLRVVIDAQRAQVVSVEPVGGPPMLHGGPYA